MIINDGDEIRAVGFIAIHAAHLEARINDLLVLLIPVQPYPEDEQRKAISWKIAECKKRLRKLDSQAHVQLLNDLDICRDRFEWRNEIMHSQLFAPEYNAENLVSSRPGVAPRAVNVSELYELANDLSDLDAVIHRPQIFEIPQSLEKYIEVNKRVFHTTRIRDGHVVWPFEYNFDDSQVNCPICIEIIKSRS